MLSLFNKKKKISSLCSQLIFKVGILLIILITIITVFQYILLKDSLYTNSKNLLESRLHNIEAEEIIKVNTYDDLKNIADDFIYKMIDADVSVLIIDKNGEVLADSENNARNIYSGHILKDSKLNMNNTINTPKYSKEYYNKLVNNSGLLKGYQIIKNSSGEKFMIQFVKVGSPNDSIGLIQLSTTLSPMNKILRTSILIFVIFSLIVLVISWFLVKGITLKSLKPLNSVTDTIEKINAEKLHIRIPEDTNQLEINRLAASFNGMLEKIETSFKKETEIKDKMKKFVSDASHELKTPITSIHGFAEVLIMGAAKDEKQLLSSLKAIMNESDRLNRLINSLLLLSKIDQNYEPPMAKENLSQIIIDIKPQLEIMASKRKLELNIENDIFIYANKDQIKQVILNLMQNSVRYSSEDSGIIKISLNFMQNGKNKYAKFSIEDNGIGISDENMSSIFDRFYRVNSHRSREQGGYGLGLSIVKSIIDSHEGEISVISNIGKGTNFTILFKILE